MECSLCSLINFFFGCIHSLVACALDYPATVFMLSALIAVILVTNVHTARLLCAGSTTNVCNKMSNTRSMRYVNSGQKCSKGTTINFDYGAQKGPHTWVHPESNQSPINIVDEFVQKFPIRELLTWNHYDDLPCAVMLENSGHTLIVRAVYNGNIPTLSGADLLACYTFVELCFRWSAFNSEGSEHMINYKKFPLELQAMHRTGPSNDCTSSYDLLMVAYLFEVSHTNYYLTPIIQNLHRLRAPGSRIEIPPFPLSYLCHPFRTGFYSYGGSLTQPPCYEGAEWFIYPEPLAVSESQLHEFRRLLSIDGKTRILRNSRPVQNLNCTRIVNFNQYNPLDNSATQMNAAEAEEQCCDEESIST